MLDAATVLSFTLLLSIGAVAVLILMLTAKTNKINQLQISVDNLRLALDEMDEQAKLVVRTDIELNKAQEELDKKLTGLYTLQRLSRTISSTFEESQIFEKIDSVYLEDLGFEKALAFLWDETEKIFVVRLNIGYADQELEQICRTVAAKKEVLVEVMKNEKTISPALLQKEGGDNGNLFSFFRTRSFVLSPILPKEGHRGILFVGADKPDTLVTEGDEELITILANQLGQALENARLFEKTWQAHQELEKRVEERTRELSLALDEVNRISKRKSDFVSSVSHELRTPLTSIKGYASILLAGKLGQVPDEVKRRLEKINKHSDELVHFVNELLDISRLESGRVTMRLLPMEIKVIVDEVYDMLSVLMKEKEIDFKCIVPEKLPEVLLDKEQIKRVFINLINNAIKYTPAHGKITVTTRMVNKEIHTDITDNGCGIPEDALGKLFVEFYRVDTAVNQEVKGTGLGLALVKHIIEAHKGKIWVKSKLGAGSTFSFSLPLPEP